MQSETVHLSIFASSSRSRYLSPRSRATPGWCISRPPPALPRCEGSLAGSCLRIISSCAHINSPFDMIVPSTQCCGPVPLFSPASSSGSVSRPCGAPWPPPKSCMIPGTFDGQGHTISNVTFRSGYPVCGVGVIGMNLGEVRNLTAETFRFPAPTSIPWPLAALWATAWAWRTASP